RLLRPLSIRPPPPPTPRTTLFPYTTLFRSQLDEVVDVVLGEPPQQQALGLQEDLHRPILPSADRPVEKVQDPADLADPLVDVERRVPGREHIQLAWMTARCELLDIVHGLAVRTAAVVLADHHEHGCANVGD